MKNVVVFLIISVIIAIIGVTLLFFNQSRPQQPIISDLEQFLKTNNAKGDVAEAYIFAQENPQQVLSKVKCYCGCLNQGHQNSRDCFINEDSSFDLMGLNCGLCVKTALVAKQMLAGSKSVQEISDFVDNRWGKNLQ